MPKDWSDELRQVTFRCDVCRHTWKGEPDLVEPDPEQAHHPFRYFATCTLCEAKHQPQAPWERALLKAHQHATGPRTPEGVAATSANLVGHPTPEEALRTRFNGMKHGLSASVATYFPAKPGKYAFCQQCDVDRYWCADQPCCVKQTELFMLHHAAFEQRNPAVLAKVHANMHAALVASLQMCLQAVLADGVVIATPKVQIHEGRSVTLKYVDQHGAEHAVMEYMANPAFKPIADLVTRLGLSLADLGMTVKAAADEESELRGRLAGAAVATEALQDFSARMAATMEKLPGMLKAAREDAEKDPVLLEHQAATGGGGGAGGGA